MVEREETLSYEGVLQRDLEYLKRMKMTLLQHPVASGLLRSPSQELPSKPRLAGKKRKSICSQPHETTPRASHDIHLLPVELSDRQAPPSLQMPLVFQQSKDRQWAQMQPLLHHQDNLQSLQRSLRQEPWPQQLLNQQPPQTKAATVWCNICNLNCVTHHNLKIHIQGKKHKAKWDAQSSKVKGKAKCGELSLQVHSHAQKPPQRETVLAWCSLCKVNCKNPQNLRRHLQGRKHKAKWDKQYPQVGLETGSEEAGTRVYRTLDEQPLQIQTGPVWCTLCKLNCMNPANLKRHLQGKKHRDKWNEQPLQTFCPENPEPPDIQITPVLCKALQIGLHEPS